MAENEGIEEKNIAEEKRKEAKQKFLEAVQDLKEGHTKVIGILEAQTIKEGKKLIIKKELVVRKNNDQYLISINGNTFAIANKDGNFIYINKLADLENKLKMEDESLSLRDLNLPGLDEALDREEQAKKQEEHQTKNKEEKQEVENQGDEQEDEVGDEKPELEESQEEKLEQLSEKYKIPAGQITHFKPHSKRITKDENLAELSQIFDEYDDVFSFPTENKKTQKFVGVKNGKEEKIELENKQIWGKNPNIKIKLIDDDKIKTDLKVLSAYELNENGDVMAFIENEHGESDALYCRPEAKDKKSYIAARIPEASVKNVEQGSPEVREAVSSRYNSSRDLSKLSDRIEEQEALEKQGLKSGTQGAELNEVKNKSEMHEKDINIIIERLNEDGIKDEPPGKCQYFAEKVLDKMKKDGKDIENAIEEVMKEGQKEPGGRTPGEPNKDKRWA